MLAPLVSSQDEQYTLENCANLYVANGCDDRQFSLVVRMSGVPSDAHMPLSRGFFTLLVSFWVLDRNGDGAKVGQAGRAARASH